MIVVGDPRQSIYAFRGADHASMENLHAMRADWHERELSLTFRCPKSVVARQLAHYESFRAHERNAEGEVLKLGEYGAEDAEGGWSWTDVLRAAERVGGAHSASRTPSIAVLCRNNGPLFAMAFKLLRNGIGVVMLGRDIGKGLEVLARKLAPEDNTPVDLVRGAIEQWREGEVARLLANGHEERIGRVEDQAECLLAVMENAEVKDAGALRAVLGRLFSRESGQVTLSSVHRAKGLEWDCVVLLDPWRIPSKYARQAAAQGDQRQMRQEMNLRYVAETRTKHTLVLANLEDFSAA
jgi:superfamily I DNA/RNA helicase